MPIPMAYLLTWTTYGTWLHGDERGSVDALHNRFGTPAAPPSAKVEARRTAALARAPLFMSVEMRRAVRDAIVEHCPFRKATLRALNVRTNHVHLVVRAETDDPGDLEGRFKARATRALRERGLVGATDDVWTHRGSTRYLWCAEHVDGACRYVLEDQGPMDEFAVDGRGRATGT